MSEKPVVSWVLLVNCLRVRSHCGNHLCWVFFYALAEGRWGDLVLQVTLQRPWFCTVVPKSQAQPMLIQPTLVPRLGAKRGGWTDQGRAPPGRFGGPAQPPALSPRLEERGLSSVGPAPSWGGTWERRRRAGRGAGRDLRRRAGRGHPRPPGAPQESPLSGACEGALSVVSGLSVSVHFSLSAFFHSQERNDLPLLGERSQCWLVRYSQ